MKRSLGLTTQTVEQRATLTERSNRGCCMAETPIRSMSSQIGRPQLSCAEG